MPRDDHDKADREFYIAYMGSVQWDRRRQRSLKLAGYRCEYEAGHDSPNERLVRCHRRRLLEVHHKTYVRLGHEDDGDLEVLCWFHHQVEHMMWQVCTTCRIPVLGSYANAEEWLTGQLLQMGITLQDLEAGVRRAWMPEERRGVWIDLRTRVLPTKATLESMLPGQCEECLGS